MTVHDNVAAAFLRERGERHYEKLCDSDREWEEWAADCAEVALEAIIATPISDAVQRTVARAVCPGRYHCKCMDTGCGYHHFGDDMTVARNAINAYLATMQKQAT
jgi:hypothetical protein